MNSFTISTLLSYGFANTVKNLTFDHSFSFNQPIDRLSLKNVNILIFTYSFNQPMS